MKWFHLALVFVIASCTSTHYHLSELELQQIKNDIIQRSEKHASDLENLDYKSVMTFYANVPDFTIFGDGYYWGDYQTVDGIWKSIIADGEWKKVIKWDLQNHKIFIHTKDAASYLVEFDHLHIGANGDTAGSSGCFTYGMQKIDGQWKAVTVHVSHIPQRTNEEKWWSKFAPAMRNKNK